MCHDLCSVDKWQWAPLRQCRLCMLQTSSRSIATEYSCHRTATWSLKRKSPKP